MARSPCFRLVENQPPQPQPRVGTASKTASHLNCRSPAYSVLSTLGIVQLLVINFWIVPANVHVVDIKMSLGLPIDIHHRTIGAMIHDHNFYLRRPRLHYRPTGNAAPEMVSNAQRMEVQMNMTYAQLLLLGSQYGVPEDMRL